MSAYRYTAAYTGSSTTEQGVISAPSPLEARRALRAAGLHPIRIREIQDYDRFGPISSWVQHHLRKRRTSTKAELFDGFATLLRSGVTPRDALLVLADSRGKSTGVGTLARLLAEDLSQGTPLSDAARGHPGWFDEPECAVIQAGERAGELEGSLTRLADREMRSSDLSSRMTSVLAYPMIVTVAGVGVAIFLANHTLPQLAQVLTDAGVGVPGITKVVMTLGQSAIGFAIPIILVLIICLLLVSMLMKRTDAARIDQLMRFAPRVFRRIATAESFLVLADLTDSGLTLVESVRVVAPTASGPIGKSLAREWITIAEQIEQGEPFEGALENRTWFTPEHQRLIGSGMLAGELSITLRRVGERDRRSAYRLIDRFAQLAEPAAIILLTFFVGSVVLAAVLPIVRLQEIIG